MFSTGNTNFRELYFEHKELTRIMDEPTFGPLHNMLLELKANASSISCNLGGGAHSYARYIVSHVTYATIAPLTPFIIPLHTGPLSVAVGATQFKFCWLVDFTKNLAALLRATSSYNFPSSNRISRQ